MADATLVENFADSSFELSSERSSPSPHVISISSSPVVGGQTEGLIISSPDVPRLATRLRRATNARAEKVRLAAEVSNFPVFSDER